MRLRRGTRDALLTQHLPQLLGEVARSLRGGRGTRRGCSGRARCATLRVSRSATSDWTALTAGFRSVCPGGTMPATARRSATSSEIGFPRIGPFRRTPRYGCWAKTPFRWDSIAGRPSAWLPSNPTMSATLLGEEDGHGAPIAVVPAAEELLIEGLHGVPNSRGRASSCDQRYPSGGEKYMNHVARCRRGRPVGIARPRSCPRGPRPTTRPSWGARIGSESLRGRRRRRCAPIRLRRARGPCGRRRCDPRRPPSRTRSGRRTAIHSRAESARVRLRGAPRRAACRRG